MIHLTPEGLATAIAAAVFIVAYVAVNARRQRRNEARAQYLRGEQNQHVARLKADVLETINCDIRRFS
jgi:putative exporter of polyketide antibiotics